MEDIKMGYKGTSVLDDGYYFVPGNENIPDPWPGHDRSQKQLVFPKPTTCTVISPDGEEERVRFGQYEGVMIVSENGWPVYRLSCMMPASYCVEEVMQADGTKIIFDEPLYLIEEEKYGDGSGRIAKRYRD